MSEYASVCEENANLRERLASMEKEKDRLQCAVVMLTGNTCTCDACLSSHYEWADKHQDEQRAKESVSLMRRALIRIAGVWGIPYDSVITNYGAMH